MGLLVSKTQGGPSMKRKPRDIIIEDHLDWKELPEQVKGFLIALQKAEKEKEGMWKDFPFGDEKALKKHPQYQITEAFEFFLGWYLHKATIQEKLTFYQLILYDTSARGWIKQYLVNEHNTEFKE